MFKTIMDNLYENKEILEESLEKYTITELCKIWKCSKGVIRKYIKKFGINYIKHNERKRLSYPSELTELQYDIVVGSLLGDSYIQFNKETKCNIYGITQCIAHKEYVEYLFDEMKPFSLNLLPGSQDGHENIKFNCGVSAIFDNLRKTWYPDGIKIVPRDIHLTPCSLSHWFMQDGNNNPLLKTIRLCTDGFTKEDNEFLVSILKRDLDIDASTSMEKEKYRVYVGNSKNENGTKFFLDIVEPYVKPFNCFSHKLNRGKKAKFARRKQLTPEEKSLIIQDYISGLTNRELVKKYNSNNVTIGKIIKNKTP